jgi:cytochrome b6-f complex iron-sulfur subunit
MTLTRRTFLEGTACAAASTCAGSLLAGCGNDVIAAPIVNAKVIDDPNDPRYGQIAVIVPMYPQLDVLGGAVTLMLAPLNAGVEHPFAVPDGGILLIHRAAPPAEPQFVALQSLCTHSGCPLGYSAKDQLVECPCHGSRFAAVADPENDVQAGQVVALPARGDLASWEVQVDNFTKTVFVDLNTSGVTKPPLPPPTGGKVTVSLADFPALMMVGGSAIGQPKGVADTLILIRVDQTTIATLSAVCTHRFCNVGYAAQSKQLLCPCHGSTFDLTGRVTKLPATQPLKSYPTTFDGQTITITIA